MSGNINCEYCKSFTQLSLDGKMLIRVCYTCDTKTPVEDSTTLYVKNVKSESIPPRRVMLYIASDRATKTIDQPCDKCKAKFTKYYYSDNMNSHHAICMCQYKD